MLIKDMLFGYYDTQCLYAVAKLGIADHLQNGSKNIDELSDLTGALPDKLYRILRYVSAKGLFDELPNKIFKLNNQSIYLLEDTEEGLNNFITMHGEYFYQGASALKDSLFSDKSSFEEIFGISAGKYFVDNPKPKGIYNTAMKENSKIQSKLILDSYDFASYKTIVDVGGGVGSLLVNILKKYGHIHGINYDIPAVEESAGSYIKENNLEERCQYICGDFFESVPGGGDLYIMKAILHGKTDIEAIKILSNCKIVLPVSGRLLIIERVLCPGEPAFIDACVNDINMLNVTKGYIRTIDEFQHIFKRAGYVLRKVHSIDGSLSLLEVDKT